MLSHALTIVINELRDHLLVYDQQGNPPAQATDIVLGNLSEGVGGNAGNVPRDVLCVSAVNIKEDKALKNLPNQTRNDTTMMTVYENPPVFLNFQILISATHANYSNALKVLSRAIRFFQFKNVFTQDSVAPQSLIRDMPDNPLDRLETFKIIFDLYSASMEELNHMWGIIGGKEYPFILYMMRLLDFKFPAVQSESGVITEVVRDFLHKKPAEN